MFRTKILKSAAALFLLSLFSLPALGHNLWIETSTNGEVGQSQKAYIYLGEYAYGVREDVSTQEHQEMLGEVSLWLIKPNGEKVELETAIDGNRFVAEFTPEEQGHYRLALNVTKAPVVDWTEYNLGVLKTNFFGSALVSVGSSEDGPLPLESIAEANQLVIQPVEAVSFERKSPIQFKVTYKGEPLAEQEVNVGYKDQWFKTLYTDEEGIVTVSLLWDDQYVVETVYTEESPGNFQGDDYEAIRQTATFSIPAAN
ncbi:DUF4198 domain-containing protein [Fodinibius salsisoli]|uniref:DUF4198 domain-containing protein n=1 Tax=Fodinibius salsisoli TaxID=2820877 RepID=A0ABT3PNW1_9BACT|nr:DUF4198 domain-containing protein [Fodinibius salsisoli]MCW9707548.1 DUF4198 domain-containing protein [Fodinibius salsisoli]